MTVDAGYVRHFTWLIPWFWGGSAALWTAWIITHDKIAKDWLKRFHEKMGRGIQPIRMVLCLIVFLAVSLGLKALMKPSNQSVASSPAQPAVTRPITPPLTSPQPGLPKALTKKQHSLKSGPSQENSVHVEDGSKIEQQSNGDCSPNMIGGANTVNCVPALKLMPTQTIMPSDQEGLIKTLITVVPNRDVQPPVNVILKFDIPPKSVGVWISGSGGITAGGPGSVSSGTDQVIPLGTGFTPEHALLLTVYSASPIKLLEIHLE